MKILLIMCLGIIIGYKYLNENYSKISSLIQMICTIILIFSMGVSLGNRKEFFSELSTLGIKSLIFSIFPIIFSIIFVFILSKKFIENNKEDN